MQFPKYANQPGREGGLPAWHTPRPGWQSGTAGVETVLGHWMADWATHLVVGVSDSAGEQGWGGGGGV